MSSYKILCYNTYTLKLLGTGELPVGIFGCRPRVKLQEDDAHEAGVFNHSEVRAARF